MLLGLIKSRIKLENPFCKRVFQNFPIIFFIYLVTVLCRRYGREILSFTCVQSQLPINPKVFCGDFFSKKRSLNSFLLNTYCPLIFVSVSFIAIYPDIHFVRLFYKLIAETRMRYTYQRFCPFPCGLALKLHYSKLCCHVLDYRSWEGHY